MRLPYCRDHYSPVVFFLTFGCYGTHLPGDERGSVERTRNGRGGYLSPSIALVQHAQQLMRDESYILTRESATIVLSAIREVCTCRDWGLIAAHVRTTHAHVVVELTAPPERAIVDFKAYASRVLNRSEGTRRRWARGGSTVGLTSDRAIRRVVRYVISRQGNPMAVFDARSPA